MNIWANFKARILLLLLIDVAATAYIVWNDLQGDFESVGGIILFPLFVIRVAATAALWWTGIQVVRNASVRGASTIRALLLLALLIASTVALYLSPTFAVTKIAPYYDAAMLAKSEEALKLLKARYQEPTFVPAIDATMTKRVEAVLRPKGHAGIAISYVFRNSGKQVCNIGLTLQPLFKYDPSVLTGAETISIRGKEALFWGDSVIFYDSDVTRELRKSYECKVTKENLIQMMGSLEPTPFTSETLLNYSGEYRVYEKEEPVPCNAPYCFPL